MVNSAQVYSTALYNNASVPVKDAVFIENYTPRGEAADHPDRAAAVGRGNAHEGDPAGPLSASAVRDRRSRATSSAFSSAAAGRSPSSATPTARTCPDSPTSPSATAASAPRVGRSGRSRRAENAAERSGDVVSRHQRPPGDYRSSGCASCHVIYANDRSRQLGPLRAVRQRRVTASTTTRPSRRTNRAIRSSTSSRADPSSQCITCHIHNGNDVMNSYLGFMWWDEETDGEQSIPKEQKDPTPSESSRRPVQPRGGRGAGVLGRPEVPRDRQRPEPEAQAHAVRRLPRPRLGLPEGLQAGPQGQLPRRRRRDHSVRRYRPLAEGGPPQGHPPREGDALRRLPLHRRTSTATASSTAIAATAIEIECMTATARVAAATLVTSGPAHRQAATSRPPPDAVGQAAVREAGQHVIQRSMVEEGKQWDRAAGGRRRRNPKARLAHTIQTDGVTWGNGATPRISRTRIADAPATPATRRGPRTASGAICRRR